MIGDYLMRARTALIVDFKLCQLISNRLLEKRVPLLFLFFLFFFAIFRGVLKRINHEISQTKIIQKLLERKKIKSIFLFSFWFAVVQ